MSQSHGGVPSWWQQYGGTVLYLSIWFGIVFTATSMVLPK